jgi:hypothetical protein
MFIRLLDSWFQNKVQENLNSGMPLITNKFSKKKKKVSSDEQCLE